MEATEEATAHYFKLTYSHETIYAKDTDALYYRYNRQNKRWGELPERIERVECPMSEWKDYFDEGYRR